MYYKFVDYGIAVRGEVWVDESALYKLRRRQIFASVSRIEVYLLILNLILCMCRSIENAYSHDLQLKGIIIIIKTNYKT